jgi:hypothetical protein
MTDSGIKANSGAALSGNQNIPVSLDIDEMLHQCCPSRQHA